VANSARTIRFVGLPRAPHSLSAFPSLLGTIAAARCTIPLWTSALALRVIRNGTFFPQLTMPFCGTRTYGVLPDRLPARCLGNSPPSLAGRERRFGTRGIGPISAFAALCASRRVCIRVAVPAVGQGRQASIFRHRAGVDVRLVLTTLAHLHFTLCLFGRTLGIVGSVSVRTEPDRNV
jgi:hypothetical protein